MANVFDLLDTEWQQLARSRQASRQLADVCAIAGGATSLNDVERYVRAAGPAEADAVLVSLVRRASPRARSMTVRHPRMVIWATRVVSASHAWSTGRSPGHSVLIGVRLPREPP